MKFKKFAVMFLSALSVTSLLSGCGKNNTDAQSAFPAAGGEESGNS